MFCSSQIYQDKLVTVKVEIKNFRNSKGVVIINLFNKNQVLIETIKSTVVDGVCEFELKGINEALYGIKYFHDENKDKKWGKNFLGMPTEGFGYSNNAKKKFSEPDFEDWLFKVDEKTTLDLTITYLL